MAALDFPSSPTIGQLYTANSKTYQWNGTSWITYTIPVTSNEDELARTLATLALP